MRFVKEIWRRDIICGTNVFDRKMLGKRWASLSKVEEMLYVVMYMVGFDRKKENKWLWKCEIFAIFWCIWSMDCEESKDF